MRDMNMKRSRARSFILNCNITQLHYVELK